MLCIIKPLFDEQKILRNFFCNLKFLLIKWLNYLSHCQCLVMGLTQNFWGKLENHWKNLGIFQNLWHQSMLHLSSDHLAKVWLPYLPPLSGYSIFSKPHFLSQTQILRKSIWGFFTKSFINKHLIWVRKILGMALIPAFDILCVIMTL